MTNATHRSFTLLEVLVGLALLAVIGVSVLGLQSAALRHAHHARLRAAAVEQLEALLWRWSCDRAPVTLPTDGRFSPELTWRRTVEPVAIGGVIATHVTVRVYAQGDSQADREVCRVDFLVPRARPRGWEESAHAD